MPSNKTVSDQLEENRRVIRKTTVTEEFIENLPPPAPRVPVCTDEDGDEVDCTPPSRRGRR
jgi:transcription antitermination factor NusA-like protein